MLIIRMRGGGGGGGRLYLFSLCDTLVNFFFVCNIIFYIFNTARHMDLNRKRLCHINVWLDALLIYVAFLCTDLNEMLLESS